MSESKHRQTPWKRSYRSDFADGAIIRSADDAFVCGGKSEDIAHIVKCVNAHDGLVQALREIAAFDCHTANRTAEAAQKAKSAIRAAGIEVAP